MLEQDLAKLYFVSNHHNRHDFFNFGLSFTKALKLTIYNIDLTAIQATVG